MDDKNTAEASTEEKLPLGLGEIDNIQAEAFEKELAQVDAENEPDYNPEAVEQAAKTEAQAEQQTEQDIQEGSEIAAWAGVGAIEGALQTFVHHRFVFSEDSKKYAVENMGLLIAKYGEVVPLWLAKYKEEIGGMKAVAVLGKEAVVGIKTLNEEDRLIELEAAKNKGGAEDNGTHQAQ